jgi:hypothetical protein
LFAHLKFHNLMTHQSSPSPHFTDLDVAPANLFDVNAARGAQPVVPLATSPNAKPAPARRSWLLGAIAVSALVGSLTGIAAFSLYQRRNVNRAVAAPLVAASPIVAPTATPQTLASPVVEASAIVTATPTKPDGNDELHAGATPSTGNARADKPETHANRAASDDTEAGARAKRNAKESAATSSAKTPNDTSARARPNDSPTSRDREARTTTRNENSHARETRSAGRERRVTAAPRTEQSSNVESDVSPTSRPGYVDAVRRAIGDRPGRGRRQQQRREREANADRVREIFEGQSPRR